MSGQFDHIKLGRDIRDHVKAELKALSGWPSYVLAHGWTGKTERITTPEIRQACVDLGLDLNAVCVSYALRPGNKALPIAANDAESDALDASAAIDINKWSDTMGIEAPQPTAVDGAVSFEGLDVQTLMEDALAPASAHLTPYLSNMLPGLIRPFIEAAVRGPRVVHDVQTVTQLVDENGAWVTGAPASFASPNVVKMSNLFDAFKLRRSDAPPNYRHAFDTIKVPVCDYADAPTVDPHYIWAPKMLAQVAACDMKGGNSWVYGPAGVGKSDGVRQYAAALKRPFFRIALERTTEPSEIIGLEAPHKGSTRWLDGKLTRAIRVPYAVVLIDEPTLLRSGTLAVFQTALDQRQLRLGSGELVNMAQGVFIVAADNTAGNGDDSGRYVDVAPVNAAFLDRFMLKTPVAYLPEALEIKMISNKTGVHPTIARHMVDYAKLTRIQTDQGRLTMGLSPRRLLAWADSVMVGITSAEAFNAAVITGSAPEDKEPLIVLEGQTLKSLHEVIDGIVRGVVNPDAPLSTQHQQGGVSAVGDNFPDIDVDASS